MGGPQAAQWRKQGAIALLLALAMAVLYFTTDAVQGLDRRLYDAATSGAARQPLPEIVIVAIDEASLAGIGPWPWARDVHAQVIDRLAAAGAKTIVHTSLFDSPQTDRGLAYLRQIRAMLGAATPEAAALSGLVGRTLDEAEAALDTDARLAASIQRAGNVFLASRLELAAQEGGGVAARLPSFMHRSALPDPGGEVWPASRGALPVAVLGQAAAGVGYLQGWADGDGAVRQWPLLLRMDGTGLPSLALLTAAHSLHLGPADMQLVAGHALRLGGLVIPTDGAAMLRPHRYPAVHTVLSFQDVLQGKVPPARLQNRIVLIGATATSVQAPVPAGGAQALAPVQWLAHQISSIRQGHGYTEPGWSLPVMWLALGAVVLYLAVALPAMSLPVGAVATLALAGALVGWQWFWLQSMSQWLHLMLPVLASLAGLLVHAVRSQSLKLTGASPDDRGAQEAERMMALALQGQGQLDMAYERLRRLPCGLQVQDNLMHLAQDFERRHQYDKARVVYEHILRHEREHKEARVRRKRVRHLAEVAAQAGASAAVAAEPADAGPSLLGRYQIEKELGRGAMGVVYQGRDPKIGRVVAIKALALGQEFDGSALVDARARFFREAESAGRLQHQNIVTIYDAGDEHGLAWIAMELLKGQDLTSAAKPGHLLPMAQVVSILARVADALDYAHQQNVVHRDIKPANIMYDAATDAVKVSDFGIARITDSSKTRTGLVLGTPSFMAPEQLAGHKVDGRCDLYALGVTLYQLLTGGLPLRGESMSELMHNIAHMPAPDVRELRSDVPPELARIVALALRKHPQERYQTGRQFAADLRNVENAFQAGGADALAKHSLVYDERSDLNERQNMVDFQETVMDDPAQRPPVSAPRPGAQ